MAAVISASTAASGGGPEGADALLGGLRWGIWSAIAFAVLALVLVVVFMRPGSREIGRSSADVTEP